MNLFPTGDLPQHVVICFLPWPGL